jgi:hypothetical protein
LVMKSVTTFRFRQALKQLPEKVQLKARNTYHVWQENPQHPSLNFKQIHSRDPIYSIRIGIGCRALGVKNDNTMVWFWIGSHEEYNALIKTM